MQITTNYITKGYLEREFINKIKQAYCDEKVDDKVSPIISLKLTARSSIFYYLSFVSMEADCTNLFEVKMPLFSVNSKQIGYKASRLVWQKYQMLVRNDSTFMKNLCSVLKVNDIEAISIRENSDQIAKPEFSQIIINPR